MNATDPADVSELAFRLCARTVPVPGHAALLDALRREGGPEFVPRLSRGGWFRPGRILDGEGRCVAMDAFAWLEAEWAAAGEDPEHFAERHASRGFLVTREEGTSHYLVAPRGPGAADHLQLEIEELQEVASHPLLGGQGPADSIEALLERPRNAVSRALGAPRYSFRRLADVAEVVSRIAASQPGKPPPVLRFLDEWESSSAGRHSRLCDHWVLAIADHLDRHGRNRQGAVPVAAHVPAWQGDPSARGLPLARALHDFDRGAGYGFAWYFHMVSGRRVPRSLPAAVSADLREGMAYLPERDAALVEAWLAAPYSV